MRLSPAQLQISAIWIDMLGTDGRSAAEKASSIFQPLPAVVQFHDPNRLAGAAVASAIGAPAKIAWDMYLFYTSGSRFEGEFPMPHDWAHQLGQTDWADPSRFHWGKDLPSALRSKMRAMLEEERSDG